MIFVGTKSVLTTFTLGTIYEYVEQKFGSLDIVLKLLLCIRSLRRNSQKSHEMSPWLFNCFSAKIS